jgi:ribonucleoside-diphosphate reductase alpha chain
VTLLNCFVMGTVEDSLDGIFEALKEGARTMQSGGGIGYDFSTLRPYGWPARTSGTIASGPVSFLRIWDAMCATLLSTGARRGAMMATLRCDHPDIERFVDAKREAVALAHFNLSVQITDDFMAAVRAGADWPLVYPLATGESASGPVLDRVWSADRRAQKCRVARVVPARELWLRILRAAYDSAEPGVLFVDQINRENNLHDQEQLSATNPCGEIPLPPYGACTLGSLNLTRFVIEPYEPGARFDYRRLEESTKLAVRLLDNVIDLSWFPLEKQREVARRSRRLGLGITGLADALVMVGQRYDGWTARGLASELIQRICLAAYEASIDLARERGAFPSFNPAGFLTSRFIARLPERIRAGIARDGIRNSHLLAIAPAGTISLLAGNVSGGIEPIFALDAERHILEPDGVSRVLRVQDCAWRLWQAKNPRVAPPAALVTAADIDIEAHLRMQACLQPWVDNAIAKTINVPAQTSFEDFCNIFDRAHEMGLKGCTVFRPGTVRGEILTAVSGRAG